MGTLILFANNASSTLVAPITASATTAFLAPGTGVLFPIPINGQYFPLTFVSAANAINSEIVYVTGMAGDTILTMTRAQEGTVAQAFVVGDTAQALITAGALNIIVAALNQAGTIPTPNAGYTLANLPAPAPLTAGTQTFCTNGCNVGELTGFGTGTLVNVKPILSVNTWCAIWSGIAVTD